MKVNSYLHFKLSDDFGLGLIEEILSRKYAFKVEAATSERWTFFDTFDWRLFSRSLVLRQIGRELSLDDLSTDRSLQGMTNDSVPGFVWDLPDGQIRQRLEPIVKMRAFLPLVEVIAKSSLFRVLNSDEKTVARLIATEVREANGHGDFVLGNYLSLWPVRGYPKYSRRLVKQLNHVGQSTLLIKNVYLSALERSGKKPGSYSGTFDIKLKAKKRSDFSTKEILRHLFKIMRANESGIKSDIDTEFLHDYRIAIRRTRSALSQIRGVLPPDTTEKFKKDFRSLGQRTNELRDLDVYLMSEASFQSRLPEAMREDIAPLFDHLRGLRKAAFNEVARSLSSSKYEEILDEWDDFLNMPLPKEPSAPNAKMPIINLAQKRIFKRYCRVIREGDYILTHTQDELLHALRIECKKLRYMMEFFSSLFPKKKMNSLIKQLKRLQDNLGEFNDLSVQQEYLMKMAEELPNDDTRSRKALVATGYLVENLGYKQETVKAEFASTFTQFASPANQKLFRRLFAAKRKKAKR